MKRRRWSQSTSVKRYSTVVSIGAAWRRLPLPLQPRLPNHPHRLALRHGRGGDDIQHDSAKRRPDLGLLRAEEIGEHTDERPLLDALATLDRGMPHAGCGTAQHFRPIEKQRLAHE